MVGQGLLVKQGLAQRVRIQASLSRQSPLSLHLRGGRGLLTVNRVLASNHTYLFCIVKLFVIQLDCYHFVLLF